MMEMTMESIHVERYSTYKDSGVEWIGEVPEHWSVSRLGILLTPISENNNVELPLLSITREKGVILRDLDNEEENHNYVPDDLSNYKVLRRGQFGMNKMKAWQGSYGISDYDGIVSPAYFIFDLSETIHPKYFHLAIRSRLYISFFGAASDGVRVGQWDLSKSRMKQVPFLLPTLPEQTRIAQFLDQKTAQIDQAIAQKERLIELLKERRLVFINQILTTGLDSECSFKDSNIDGLGQMPLHWRAISLKYLLQERVERSMTGEEPLFMVSQTHGLVVRADYHEKAMVAQSNIGNKRVYKNDLVFNKLKAHLGVFFKSNIEEVGIVSPDYAVYYPIGGIADMKFLELLFRHPAYIGQFICKATGIVEGLIRLYTSELFSIKVPVPPINEQNQILERIEGFAQKIDKAITFKQSEIEKLKEYKTTLINSAVTGKIKIN